MGNEAKSSGTNGGAAAGAGGGFRARMDRYLYSGEKKHVFAGIVIISAVFAVPWFLMNQGSYSSLSIFYFFKLDSKNFCFLRRKL